MPTIYVNRLLRYTDLASLILLLTERKVTLLNPERWDDRNDAYFMKLYKDRKHFKSLLGLCFSQSSETYHHWKVFASGASGVCVTFNRRKLLDHLNSKRGVRTGDVSYRNLKDLKNDKPGLEDLPFLKRSPFSPEAEYRVIYVNKSKVVENWHFAIALDCIEAITLSPWLHQSMFEPVSDCLRGISGCEHMNIRPSSLISNDGWKNYGERAGL